ncbi:carbohydrate ABC transporter permease [Kineosporia succinea]|uniref:Multiple sugar transport system permease protein n=1 Tax=Kineosporia succinea TaxID=84632 RepID=A0ABT9PAI2_9ACTN|nr:sugar ABC transporter permease [Kineosporia succinea]MDP9829561.1 multiple sugar transport system permease protein [Kineosporia succinea]
MTSVPLERTRVLRGLPLVPAVGLMLVFLAGPILYCLYSAFTDMALTGSSGASFVGLENFRKAFASDEFGRALRYTLLFTVVSAIVGQNILGMALALLMRTGGRVVRTVVSAIVIGAWVLPEVVAGYLWLAFLGDEGPLNQILGVLHLPEQDWLFSLPILAVSLANIWRGTAFSMLVYSAALSEVPREIEEAATMDGAGPVRRLASVTIPMVRRTIATNLMLITLQTLSVFGLIWTMTRGGPSGASTTLPLYAYQQAFQLSQLGYGTALALVLLGLGGVFSLIYLRMLRSEEAVR